MLPRHNRLKKITDFDSVFKKGKTIAGKLIFLKIVKNKLNITRFGFIVSLKISKKSTIRNRLKRQLKTLIKENFSNLKPGFDAVIITKPEIIDKSYQDIREEMKNLLEKGRLFSKDLRYNN